MSEIKRKTIIDTDIDTFSSDPGVVAAIQKQAQIANANESASKNSFPLRPSSALKPMRDLYYGLVNYYKPGTIPVTDIEGRNCMLLALGHVIEKHLVEAIRRAYKVPHTAQKIVYGEIKRGDGSVVELGGELDFVIEINGELIIADSKSSADFPFKKGDLPKDEHVAQINLYLHSSWAREKNINKAMVFYYNKNNSELKVFEFYYDALLAKKTIARFQKVHDMYEAGTLPAREHVLGVDWQAAYSNFKDYEWREFDLAFKDRQVIENVLLFAGDKKNQLRDMIKNYGTAVVKTTNGHTIWVEKRLGTLVLHDEDAEGFSS